MKALPLICTGVSLLLGVAARAQDPAAGAAQAGKTGTADTEKKAAETAPAPPARVLPGLEKLTPEQRTVMMAGMGEVSGYLRGVRLLESLEKLNEMEAAVGGNHYIENLRGAVYTKMRNFTAARPHFAKAIEFSKNMPAEAFHPRFNLAELDFVEKKFDAARTGFQNLLKDPGKPGTYSDSLMNFKIMVCNLQQKKEAEAQVLQGTFDQFDVDSPAFYYGEAAKCFAKGNKDGAAEWLDQAKRIYPKEVNEVYNDSLVEMGWLETLQ